MKHTIYLTLLLVLIIAGACSEPENYSPVLRGTISGHLAVYNEFNEPESAEGATITITAEMLHMQTTTDASGNYKIDNVPHTDLVISVKKQGFKDGQHRTLTFFTEKETIDLSISRVPTFYVNQATLYLYNNNDLRANITLNQPVPVGKNFTLATFLGKTANVSDTNYLVKSINGFTSDGDTRVQVLPSISVETLKNRHGFKSGDVAYVKIYTGAAQIYGYWAEDVYFYGPGLNTNTVSTYSITIP